ncbi:Outer membrane protein A [Buchnera aphidicola (Cinara piceae)]|uniref:Outer membrane protein A n=1 Tax=Buchnera aphidicola (Cinara piceae) TaxID=1660043 RepID=A0A803FTY8_9GAMM|nr:hypothetical protein [Buchnera aphidicola]VFP88374.1 Outer membrane protein A [Buchnera aphidicola (Cinara piceae)]
MKRISIIFVLLVSGLFSTVHAQSAPRMKKLDFGIQCNSFNLKNIFDKYKNLSYNNFNHIIKGFLALNPGIFTKYQLNPYLNFQLNSNIIEKIVKDIKTNAFNTYFSSIEYATNFMYPIRKNINFYTKIGAKLTTEVNNKKLLDIFLLSRYQQFNPILSVGIEYLFNNYLQGNMNINFHNSLKNINFNNLTKILNNIDAGISWKLCTNLSNIQKYNGQTFLQKKINVMRNEDLKYHMSHYVNNPIVSAEANRILENFKKTLNNEEKDKIILIITDHIGILGTHRCNKILSLKRTLMINKYLMKKDLLRQNFIIKKINTLKNKKFNIDNDFAYKKKILMDNMPINKKINIESK